MDTPYIFPYELEPILTDGSIITIKESEILHLEIPPGTPRRYRLAQLDDYSNLRRISFSWRPPITLTLKARVSSKGIPGTWGFGFWNDPFGMGYLANPKSFRCPTLPNAAWFFHASSQNYLSLRDDIIAHGWFTSSFYSPNRIYPILLLGLLVIPALYLPSLMKIFRKFARNFIFQDAAMINTDPTIWHSYKIHWESERIRSFVDSQLIYESALVPLTPLGLVLWIDNQYAAIHPTGYFRYGMLENTEPAWLEIRELIIS
jgi:hypothetical protein